MAILRKGFNLDFAAMAKQLGVLNDPIVSFSRSTGATRINPLTGVVESVAANIPRICGRQELWKAGCKNLCPYSNDFTNAAWNLKSLSTVVATSDGTLVTFQPGDSYLGMFAALQVGSPYTISAKVKSVNGSAYNIVIEQNGSSSGLPVTADWTTISYTHTAGAAQYWVFRPGSGTSVLIKDVQVEQSAVATTYEPNPVVLQPGLCVEGAATNLAFKMSANYWGGAPGWNVGFTTAPDGSGEAVRGSYVGSYIYNVLTNAPTKFVFSFWAKAPVNGTTVNMEAGYTMRTLTLTTEWRRYFLVENNATPRGYVFISGPSAEIHLWGPQVEANAEVPTAYIPTAGAAVTRAAEIASVDVSKIWNPNEGTIVCEADFGPVGPDRKMAYCPMDYQFSPMERVPDTGNQVVVAGWWLDFGVLTRAKIAQAVKPTEIRAAGNGGSIVNRVASYGPLTVTSIILGAGSNGNCPLNGTIQRVAYLTYALDDYTLKSASIVS